MSRGARLAAPRSRSSLGVALCALLLLGADASPGADETERSTMPRTGPAENGATVSDVTVFRFEARPRYARAEAWKVSWLSPGVTAAIGDFDCNGLDDIAAVRPGVPEVSLGLSTGGAFIDAPVPAAGLPMAHPPRWLGAGDLDSSGCADDLVALTSEDPYRLIAYLRSTEHGFVPRSLPIPTPDRELTLHMVPRRRIGDSVAVFRAATPMLDTKGWLLGPLSPVSGELPIFPTVTPAGPRVVGFGDLHGDGTEPVPMLRSVMTSQSIRKTTPLFFAADQAIGSLPSQEGWKRTVVADVNGDGRTDLLTVGKSLAGSWIWTSNGEVSIPLSLAYRPELPDAPLSGDFDGDMLIDLAELADGELRIFRSVRGTAIKGASVAVAEVPGGVTDSKGMLHLSNGVPRNTTFAVSHPGFRQVGFARRRGPRVALSMTAARQAGSERGAPFTFAGEPKGPFVCTGFRLAASTRRWGRAPELCPPNHAFMEIDDTQEVSDGVCCRLPRNDILTAETLLTEERRCPKDTVATGIGGGPTSGSRPLRCTRINVAKYVLEEPRRARYWGIGGSAPKSAAFIQRSQITPALRVAAGRVDYDLWDVDGCIGHADGALFVSLPGSDCQDGLTVRLLERAREAQAESPILAPVEMFPRCSSPPDPYDPTRGCESLP